MYIKYLHLEQSVPANIPVYFIMGKYDGMTSPVTAEKYLNSIKGNGTKEFILFDEPAHYPQFEEEGKFCQFMKDVFINQSDSYK